MIKGIIFDFNRTVFDPDKNKLVDGSLETLIKAKERNLKMCLISKNTHPKRKEQINNLGITEFFDKILIIDGLKSYGHFQECFEKMGINPTETAVIGDRINGEIYFGNYFGCKTIRFRKGKFSIEKPKEQLEIADHTIVDIKDIFKYI